MRIKTAFAKAGVLFGVLLVAGCLVPEKFAADATINKDKSYAFAFKGTMVHLPYRMDQSKTGKDSPERQADRDAEMADLGEDLLEREGDTFKKVRYAGNGVFDIEYAAAGNLTGTYVFPNSQAKLIRFSPENDGTIVVQGEGEEGWGELKKYGIAVDGKFSLTTDAEVLEHNAKKTPGMFSKAYVWEIGPGKPIPYMILKSSD